MNLNSRNRALKHLSQGQLQNSETFSTNFEPNNRSWLTRKYEKTLGNEETKREHHKKRFGHYMHSLNENVLTQSSKNKIINLKSKGASNELLNSIKKALKIVDLNPGLNYSQRESYLNSVVPEYIE